VPAPVSVPVSVPAPRVEPTVAAIPWKQVIGIKPGDRPLIVWMTDGADLSIERRTFDDDSVRLATHAFRTVRIRSAVARNDTHLSPYSRSGAVMLVFSPDLTRVRTTYGPNIDARSALDAMRAAAKADVGLDLDAAISRARTLSGSEKEVLREVQALSRTTPIDLERKAALDRKLAAIRAEEEAVFRSSPKPAR
jgi:hypothetical protein